MYVLYKYVLMQLLGVVTSRIVLESDVITMLTLMEQSCGESRTA